MSMGQDALAADSSTYSVHHRHAQAEIGVLQDCPMTDDESRLRWELHRVLDFGGFGDPLLWDNQSALDVFGQGLWEIGDSIYSGHPPQEALARTEKLIADLEAMGYVVR
jgi:hypothetical protein